MVSLTINGRSVSVKEGTTILEAARKAKIHIPHLCYLKDLNEIGACRLCSVEVEGEDKLIPACDNVVRDGMVVITNSPRVKNATRTNLELIMSQHDSNCTSCKRSGNCMLQTLANDYNLTGTTFKQQSLSKKRREWDQTFPIIRDAGKCIKCMRCVQVCDKIQNMGVWDLVGTGAHAHVDIAGKAGIRNSDCTQCGQCITHCPVGALTERDDTEKVMAALEDKDKVTVVQIAPAVRAGYAESLGLDPEVATVNRLAGALKLIGFDYVFDTSFAADLTIMEEGKEFVRRFTSGELNEVPMFTSCCPGWVNFVKSQYPEFLPKLSTAKSPQQMFGAVTKAFFGQKMGIDPEKIVCVSIMPCTAKKGESELESMQKDGIKDVDYVLTTREVMRMFKSERIHLNNVREVPFDSVLGEYTGAGVIFGTTGGVMEAALRSAYYFVTGKKPSADAFTEIRAFSMEDKGVSFEKEDSGEKGVKSKKAVCWREATYDLEGTPVKVAVTSGLGNARKLLEAIKRKELNVNFVEIMACPGGCAGGGGQPIPGDDSERGMARGELLRDIDACSKVRFSHENKEVMKLYEEWLKEPGSEIAEEYLHTHH